MGYYEICTTSLLEDCLPQLVLCCYGKVSQLATLPITSIAIHCVGQLTKRTMGVWTEEYGTYNETASTLTSASSYMQVICSTFPHKSKTDLDVIQNIDVANNVAMH